MVTTGQHITTFSYDEVTGTGPNDVATGLWDIGSTITVAPIPGRWQRREGTAVSS
jgi:hypothetical protein